jgi:hypothetical protein
MPDRRFAMLAARLIRAGVAPKRAQRLALELSEHVEDLVAASVAQGVTSTDAHEEAARQIGTDDALVAGILAQPALKSWGYRWPAIVFGLAPLLLYVTSFVLLCVLLVQTADLLLRNLLGSGGSPFNAPGAIAVVAAASRYFILYGLPSLWCFAVMRYASDRHLPWRWPALGIATTALLSAAINFDYVLPSLGVPGTVTAGIGLSTEWSQLALLGARMLVTLALSAALYLAFRRISPVSASA